MSGSGPRPVGWATGLGAASSSCSYAAIAIAKSLFQKGASAAVGARVPVRLDQPRVGARPGAVGADRLAVHARRVPRRDRDDRADDACCCGCSSAARSRSRPASTRIEADTGHQHHMRRRAAVLARAADLGAGVVGRRAQLPRRLADAVEGDHDRVPARRVHRPARQRLLRRPVPHERAGAAADDART